MAVKAEDIVVLKPEAAVIKAAATYGLKSWFHTYNRMQKGAWKRVARIARGKANELLVRQYAESLGLKPGTEEKSYRQHDHFDFEISGSQGDILADVKTFHVLDMFIEPPRKSFSIEDLLNSVSSSEEGWYNFYPMLIPQDYRQFKDIYLFGVSVEEKSAPLKDRTADFPWCAFFDLPEEDFISDKGRIRRREQQGRGLTAEIVVPEDLPGYADVIFERNGEARRTKPFQLKGKKSVALEDMSSILSVRLDDEAYQYLNQSKQPVSVRIEEDGTKICSLLTERRFYEIFPREGYTLYLIGWTSIEDFRTNAGILPAGSPCYFYPAETGCSTHQPGTKTANYYMLPRELNPLAELRRWIDAR